MNNKMIKMQMIKNKQEMLNKFTIYIHKLKILKITIQIH